MPRGPLRAHSCGEIMGPQAGGDPTGHAAVDEAALSPSPWPALLGDTRCGIQFALLCLLSEEVLARSFSLVIGLNSLFFSLVSIEIWVDTHSVCGCDGSLCDFSARI